MDNDPEALSVKDSLELTLSDGSQVNVPILILNGHRHHKLAVLVGFLLFGLTDTTDVTEVSEGITAAEVGTKSSPENICLAPNVLPELHRSVPHL